VIYLDTHVVVVLYLGQLDKLSQAASAAMEADNLKISPAVVLELEYLHEIGRLREPARTVLVGLASAIGLHVCDLPFPAVLDRALDEKWTRDPFDRLVVAHARLAGCSLVTRDERIRLHYEAALW
jgi:PIN domain nuclease of toxin-antitoxin system